MSAITSKPTLIGFLPPIGGLPKTEEYFNYHKSLINTGDIVYSLAATMLCAGENHLAWNFSTSADVVNEHFSKVIWAIPCRIAPPPFDQDGFPYELATNFIENIKIPFISITESIQSSSYDYDNNLHKKLSKKVIRYLKVISEKTHTIGVRGNYSAEILNQLGIKNIEPIGCPSLYMNGEELNPLLLKKMEFSKIKRISIAYSNHQHRSNSLISNAIYLAATRGYFFVEQTSNIVPKLLYYPHKITDSDLSEAHNYYGNLNYLRSIYLQNRLRYFTNYKNWKTFLSQMDFVFGARMHGLVPAIESGVQAYFIAHDSRIREMCEFFDLPFSPEYHLEDGLNIEKLYNRTDYSIASKTYKYNYKRFVEFILKNKIVNSYNEFKKIPKQVNYMPSPGVEIELNPKIRSDIEVNFEKWSPSDRVI